MIDIYRYFKNDGHESLKLVSRRHLHKKNPFGFLKPGRMLGLKMEHIQGLIYADFVNHFNYVSHNLIFIV